MTALMPEVPVTPIESGGPHHPNLFKRLGSAAVHFFNAPLTDKQQAHRQAWIAEETETMARIDAGETPDLFPARFSHGDRKAL